MNIHEYQGKALLSQYGVAVQRGILAETPDEAVQAAAQIQEQTGTGWWVVKAQVHAGGRGKGGGIKLAKSMDQVRDMSHQILGMQLVTPQTGAAGKTVHSVLIAEDVYAPGPSPTQE
ncbi:MAG: succinate--CoA ligase subunit beta, partial [Bacteroidetes bacterium]|nr:succinate--CoA ligase subunit beta [Bacteroidota bacterium]